MSEPSKNSFWNTLLELFRPFEVAAGIAGIVTLILWFLSLPAIVIAVGGTIVVTLASVGIVGHVRHSRNEKLLTLQLPLSNGKKKKLRPRSNLVFAGIDHRNLYFDENYTLWEVRHKPPEQSEGPSYCALLRFSNEPLQDSPGLPIKGLRASLTFRNPDTGFEYQRIDRGAWVREELNTFTLGVGDSRALVVARGFPPDIPHGPAEWLIWPLVNNHHSRDNYGKVFFQRMKESRLEVDVVVLAGDQGLVLYRNTFILQGDPYLELSSRNQDQPT